MKDVQKFLQRFHSASDLDTVFTSGCCYWFAYILLSRFIRDGAKIMYDEVENHFGTRINGKVYDVTGDVTDKYHWIAWDSVADEIHKQRIIRDCILF